MLAGTLRTTRRGFAWCERLVMRYQAQVVKCSPRGLSGDPFTPLMGFRLTLGAQPNCGRPTRSASSRLSTVCSPSNVMPATHSSTETTCSRAATTWPLSWRYRTLCYKPAGCTRGRQRVCVDTHRRCRCTGGGFRC